jgi:hypothetical protein
VDDGTGGKGCVRLERELAKEIFTGKIVLL